MAVQKGDLKHRRAARAAATQYTDWSERLLALSISLAAQPGQELEAKATRYLAYVCHRAADAELKDPTPRTR